METGPLRSGEVAPRWAIHNRFILGKGDRCCRNREVVDLYVYSSKFENGKSDKVHDLALIKDPLRVEFPFAISLSACSSLELGIPPRFQVYNWRCTVFGWPERDASNV